MSNRFIFTPRQPTVRVKIRGVNREFIVHTGSSVSLIKPGFCRSQVRPSRTTTFGASGRAINITGNQDVQFRFNDWSYRHTFCVCSLAVEADGILETDFLKKAKASLDFGRSVLRLQKLPMSIHGSDSRKPRGVKEEVDRVASTTFSRRDGKRCRGKQTPRHNRADGKSEKNSVSEHEPCSRSRHEGALNRDATIAKMQRQRYKESEKLGKRRPSKQRANKQRSLETQESKSRPQRKHKTRRMSIASQSSDMSAIKIGAFPLVTEAPRQDNTSANHSTP